MCAGKRGGWQDSDRDEAVGWRGPGKGKARGEAQTSGAWWTTSAGHRPMKHTVKLVLAIGLIAALALLLWPFLRPRAQTPIVGVFITEYDPLVPPNAMAQEDAQCFSQLWKADSTNKKKGIGFFGRADETKHADLDSCLSVFKDKFRPGGLNKDTVLIYVSAHGVTNAQGEPCLLLSSSQPHDDRTWLPLRAFLVEIQSRAQTKSEDPEKKVKTVVFLDASRMMWNLHLGLLYNGFNERLADVVRGIEGHLVLVNSASPGEIGWHDPQYGLSFFGRHVAEALTGVEQNKDQLTLGDLRESLIRRVSLDVRVNRAARQTPLFLATSAADADHWETWPIWVAERSPRQAKQLLATVIRKYTYDERPQQTKDRGATLDGLWQRYDEIVTGHEKRIRDAPLELAELHFHLATLERLLLAGKAYETRFQEAASRATGMLNQLATRHNPPPLVALSAPAAAQCVPLDQLALFSQSWANDPNPDSKSWEVVDFSPAVVATGIVQWLVSDQGQLNDGSQVDKMLAMIDRAGLPPATKEVEESKEEQKKEEEEEEEEEEDKQEKATSDELKPDPFAYTAGLDFVEVNLLRMVSRHLASKTDLAAVLRVIKARHQAERVVTPTDERVHYWIRERVELADRARRLAEDRLMCGPANRTEELRSAAESAEKHYQQVNDERVVLETAYAVRDRVWLQLPLVTAWAVAKAQFRPQDASANEFESLSNVAKQCRDLADLLDRPFRLDLALQEMELEESVKRRSDEITKVKELSQGRESGNDSGNEPNSESDLEPGLAPGLDAIAAKFRVQWENWPGSPDKSWLGLWGAMLEIPLTGITGISGVERAGWRTDYLKLVFRPEDVARGLADDATGGNPKAQAALGDRRLLDSLAAPKAHPLLAIVSRQSVTLPVLEGHSADDEILFLSKQSGLARSLLDAGVLSDDVLNRCKSFKTDLDEKKETRSQRSKLSEADRILRMVCALTVPASQSYSEHPTVQLRKFDARNYLLWQASRVMFDLWSDQRPDKLPYYARAFAAYASTAEDTYRMYTRSHQLDDVDLRSLCVQLRDQLDTHENATPKLDGEAVEGSGSLELPIVAQPPTLDNRQAPWAICEPHVAVRAPEGDGARTELTISAGDVNQMSVRRVGIPLYDDRRALNVRVDKNQIANKVSLDVVGFFRGRHYVSSFGIPNPEISARPTIIWRPLVDTPTVKLSGSFDKKVAIMFVLDCSSSMIAPVPDAGASRLEVATRALDTMLADLLENLDGQHECRVGLLVYGHRSGFDDSGKPIWSPAYEQWLQQNRGLKPKTGDDDLECVVHFKSPVNPLSDELRKAIAKQAESWRPLGNTPLYYAMREGLREFDSVSDVASKHLIVVTDGRNFVNGQGNSGMPPDWLKEFGVRSTSGGLEYTERQVAQMVDRNYPDVEINVLGIGMKPSDFDSQLRTINRSSLRKGKFYPVSKRAEFVSALQKALGLGDYVVQDDEGQSTPPQRVNTVCPLTTWNRNTLFTVSMPDMPSPPQSAAFLAEGGEAFDLRLDLVHRRIVHQRYEPDKRRPVNGSATDAFVSALAPERNGDTVTFAVTVQNSAPEEFSPRPLGIWATITPTRTKEGEEPVGAPYHFCDPVFERGTPVPVLEFTAQHWPPKADWAKIELWFRVKDVTHGLSSDFQDIQADAERDVASVAAQNEFQIENIPDISFRVNKEATDGNGWRMTVIERYDDAENDTHKTRVTTEPRPDQIIRYAASEGGLVRHVFEYYRGREPRRLLITSRSSLQRQYSKLEQPIFVKVHEGQ